MRNVLRILKDAAETCQLSQDSGVDMCAFVKENCTDVASDGYFKILELRYCQFQHIPVVFYILAILFIIVFIYLLGTTADAFFVPPLMFICDQLHMSQNLAGITFLSLGNGAPDLFSQLSGATEGSLNLSFSEAFGSGLFTVTILVGMIICIQPFRVTKSLMFKDAAIYLLCTTILVLVIVIRQKVDLIVALFLPLIYFGYIVFSVLLERFMKKKKQKKKQEEAKKLAKEKRQQKQNKEIPSSSTQQPETTSPSISTDSNTISTSIDSSKIIRKQSDQWDSSILSQNNQRNDQKNPSYSAQSSWANASSSQYSEQTPLVPQLQKYSSKARLPSNQSADDLFGGSQAGSNYSGFGPSYYSGINSDQDDASGRIGRHRRSGSDTQIIRSSVIRENNSWGINRIMESLYEPDYEIVGADQAGEGIYEMVKSKQKRSRSQGALQRQQLMHKNLLNLNYSDKQEHALISSEDIDEIGYKAFKDKIHADEQKKMMDITEEETNDENRENDSESQLSDKSSNESLKEKDLSKQQQIKNYFEDTFKDWTNWDERGKFGRIIGIIELPVTALRMATVPEIKNNSYIRLVSVGLTTPILQLFVGMNLGDKIGKDKKFPSFALALIIGALVLIPLAFFLNNRKIRKLWKKRIGVLCSIVFATWRLYTSILWLNWIAGETVNGLIGIAFLAQIPSTVVFATVLSWGNALGDVVANIAVSRMGRPITAVAACYAGPLINALLGLSVSSLMLFIKQKSLKPIEVGRQLELVLLLALTAASLLFTIIISLIRKMRFERWFAVILFVLYGICTIILVLVAVGVM
ncbi:MAG: Sodium/calcium exchanger [Streblomastix strix]|uniref:Sodium/calcium exchanger n=1 Tax=Streblomastix strix TaxID=222440 RepID=A0A5J4X5M7_9EUKA|nr:MAG: Sodium/calcium exchanger [Streblomastix strix]